jgi:predicted HicB family RNase H-like nuclease
VTETEKAKIPRRSRVEGRRRMVVGAYVLPELHARIIERAAERGVSVGAYASEVLAEHEGLPA